MALPVQRFALGVELPPSVYLDTNLLLHARDVLSPKYRAASTCLAELIRQGVELRVSPLVIDEFWWSLFKASYKAATGRELTGQAYKRDNSIWRGSWPRIEQITREVLAFRRFHLVSASAREVVHEALALVAGNPLAPRDAFHMAIALQNDLRGFVTADPDFERLSLPAGREIIIVRF